MSIQYYPSIVDGSACTHIKNVNSLEPRSACVLTFGCQQNEADSERIRGILCELGFVLVDDYIGADLVIFNTCAIRAHAEDKVFSLLGNLKAQKRANDRLVVGVMGCMAAELGTVEKLKTKFHYVDFTLEPNNIGLLPTLIFEAMSGGRRRFAIGIDLGDITEDVPVVRADDFRAWVSVMYGCNNFCTYCIVPYVRGRERSRASADVLRECRDLVASGVKEITLLGQNVNSYRSDVTFAELISAIAEIPGDFVIRFMTSHPKDVSDELFLAMAKYKNKIAPYFHLPLQSGSDKILRAMNRTYDREHFLSTVDRLRSAVPDIVLSTDVIVGFPGESEADFLDTLDILKRVRFDAVYGFMYSEREGTRAATFDGSVEKSVRSERLTRLFEAQEPISLAMSERFIGRDLDVVVYSVSDDGIASATAVCGRLVRFKADGITEGDNATVHITGASSYELTGEIRK